MVKSRAKTSEDLAAAKRKMAKKHKIPCPSNLDLLKTYHELAGKGRIKRSFKIENLLRTRPIRSLSGIVNVSVLTKPYPCPGKCLYCPIEKGIPKSYVSGEPAVERAKKLKYDPYLQTKKRLEMLTLEGHPTDKIELRVVGGTWSFYPKKYQTWFIKRCLEACNKKSSKLKTQSSKLQLKTKSFEGVQKINEKAKHRIVGLSIETRPDFINEKEITRLRELGVTMVELGVQSIYDDVLKVNQRGHGVKETIEATKLLKDAGFKVLYQMMPNLPGSNPKRDKKMFEELFSDSRFQPDLLKIYPTALLKEAPLYKWWKSKKYKPYTERQLINLMVSIKKEVPYYVRIQRITRDIPSQRIVAGPAKISNLRQILAEKSKKEGWKCNCIRCREVGKNYDSKEKLYLVKSAEGSAKQFNGVNLFRQDYSASGGKEIFLSFEDKKREKLYSLLRLRITSQNIAIIREVHTYGQLRPLDRKEFSAISPQHRGLGKKLIREAERIAKKESGLNKIAVIAGIGVRNYFRELGFQSEDTYMVKSLRS